LGQTVSELDLSYTKIPVVDKTLFSMCVPELTTQLTAPSNVAIVGIESHVCVLQTTLNLLKAGHATYVIKDGVSSANPEEVPIAIARMRQAGAFITTSESFVAVLFC
jgi:nicotinamidase-related amidase